MKNFFGRILAASLATIGLGGRATYTLQKAPDVSALDIMPKRKRKSRHGGSSFLRAFRRWSAKSYGPPSLRDQILLANSESAILHLLSKLSGWNHNARTLRRCNKAAQKRAHELRHPGFPQILYASGEAPEGIIYAHFESTVEIGPDNKLPDNIQWAPPGIHHIKAKQSDGKKVSRPVTVNAKGAEALQAFLTQAKKDVAAGKQDLPFFDFNHNDDDASAHPTEFYWGGDDPKTGGIRAKLEYTAGGSSALLGKRYRRFSPAMALNDAGEIVGSDINMGGFVNRAAFTRIAPIWAKADAEPDDKKPIETTHQMKTLLTILAKAGLISSSDLDEASAVSQFQTNHAALLAKSTKVETDLATVQAKNTELTTALKAENDRNVVLAKAQATEAINAAVLAKKIEPKNTVLIAKYVEMYQADPEGTKLILDAMTPNPAFVTVVHAKAGGGEGNSLATVPGEHPFLTKAKAIATEQKKTESEAAIILAKQDPTLYEEYRDSLITYGKK